MIYAVVKIKDHIDGFVDVVKLVADSVEAYNQWVKDTTEQGFTVTEEFADHDFNSVVILGEDFRY